MAPSLLVVSVSVISLLATLIDWNLLLLVDAKKLPPTGSARSAAGSAARRSSNSRRFTPISKQPKRARYEHDDRFHHNPIQEGDEIDQDELDDEEMEEEDFEEEEFNDEPPRKRPSSAPAPESATSYRKPERRRQQEPYNDVRSRPRRANDPNGFQRSSKLSPPPSSRRGPPPRGRTPASSAAAAVATKGRRSPPESASRSPVVRHDKNSSNNTKRRSKSAAFGISSSIQKLTASTGRLSSNLYRDIKGLTSSELEQVMLKATRPNDAAVKGKHIERLVGLTYQVSPRYDIYHAVLRKLWSKLCENDWRTKIKALYILHRFSADGDPKHSAGLKTTLRKLRRTQDPKHKQQKYFNAKQLMKGDENESNRKFRAFLSRYAHFVLLRAQCFGGVFAEIGGTPPPSKPNSNNQKTGPPPTTTTASQQQPPITQTFLRKENLEAAQLVLQAGLACALKDGEESENTATCIERVASDMIGLSAAVAVALNRGLQQPQRQRQRQQQVGQELGSHSSRYDAGLMKRWCEFYRDELVPGTRSMVKKTSRKLDAYGLFLQPRIGTTVAPGILERGLKGGEVEEEEEAAEQVEEEEEEMERDDGVADDEEEAQEIAAPKVEVEVGDDEDEYEYEEVEYYDDEEVEEEE